MMTLSVTKLALELRDEQVSEPDKLRYIFVLMSMTYLVGTPNVFVFLRNPRYLIVYAAMLAIAIAGILIAYSVNRAGDNRAFVERFFLLAAPISIRVVVLLYVTTFVIARTGILLRVGFMPRIYVSAVMQLVMYGLGVLWMREGMALASSGPPRVSAVIRHETTHA